MFHQHEDYACMNVPNSDDMKFQNAQMEENMQDESSIA